MRIISVINMKGGCGKTVSSINIAHILTAEHGAKVLMIDMDKQGNTSKFFDIYGYEAESVADVLTVKGYNTADAVQSTRFENLDVIPANMRLLLANREVLLDATRPQQTRLKRAMETLGGRYDYCVIDCAPDINMGTINALVASDDVLVPVSIDKFAFDGLGELIDQIENLQDFNSKLKITGCFVTMLRRDKVNAGGLAWLRENCPMPMFDTAIRATVRVGETTYTGEPLMIHAPNSTATQDYRALVRELLKR